MKLDNSKLKKQLAPLVEAFRRYHVFLFIVAFLGTYAFLVMRISSLTQNEPTLTSGTSEVEAIKQLKVDQAAIDQILELEEQNIEVQSLFKEARNNPFTE